MLRYAQDAGFELRKQQVGQVLGMKECTCSDEHRVRERLVESCIAYLRLI